MAKAEEQDQKTQDKAENKDQKAQEKSEKQDQKAQEKSEKQEQKSKQESQKQDQQAKKQQKERVEKSQKKLGDVDDEKAAYEGLVHGSHRYMIRPEEGFKPGAGEIHTVAEWKHLYGYDVYQGETTKVNPMFKVV